LGLASSAMNSICLWPYTIPIIEAVHSSDSNC